MNEGAPSVRGPEAEFYQLLHEGRFHLPRCDICGAFHFPPRVICPSCRSTAVSLVPSSGRGTIYATTTVRRKPDDGGDHNVSLVQLAEGPRLMSSVVEMPLDAIKIGMAVAVYEKRLRAGEGLYFVADRTAVPSSECKD